MIQELTTPTTWPFTEKVCWPLCSTNQPRADSPSPSTGPRPCCLGNPFSRCHSSSCSVTPPGFFSQNTNNNNNKNHNTKVQPPFECHPAPSAVLTSFQDVTCTDTFNSLVLTSLCSYGKQRPERLSYLSKVTQLGHGTTGLKPMTSFLGVWGFDSRGSRPGACL